MTTVQSALVVIPPSHLLDAVQQVRQQYDKAYDRWMPHINVLYPFVTADSYDAKQAAVERAIEQVSPFELTFDELGSFDHNTAILWAHPTTKPADALHILQARLQTVFPQCTELSQNGFSPHMTLGQFPKREIEQRKREFAHVVGPAFTFTVNEVYVITRSGNTPFTIARTIKLGESAARAPRGPRAAPVSATPLDIQRHRPEECMDQVVARMFRWAQRTKPQDRPRNADALRHLLEGFCRVRMRADTQAVLRELTRSGLVTEFNKRVRVPGATPEPAARPARGRGPRRATPAKGGRGKAPAGNFTSKQYVRLGTSDRTGTEFPASILRENVANFDDAVRRAKAWVTRVVGEHSELPKEGFLHSLEQVCDLHLSVPVEYALSYLQSQGYIGFAEGVTYNL